MIIQTFEQMRAQFALTEYGPTPTRGPDGRFLFPTDVVAYPQTGMGAAVFDALPELFPEAGASVELNTSAARIFPWRITANGYAADSVARTDEWDWYLWHEAGWLTFLPHPDTTLTETFSGTVYMYFTVPGLATFPFDGFTPTAQRTIFASDLRRLLRSTYVYAQRRSDGRVYVFDLSAIVFGGSVGAPTPEE